MRPETPIHSLLAATLTATFLTAAFLTAGCAGPPDVRAWRASSVVPRPESQRGSPQDEIVRVQLLRSQLDLRDSRQLALTLATENPGDETSLYLASRAESDAVFLFSGAESDKRAVAALSALDYAQRAVAVGAKGADARAQLAWALGTTTHLQPMFDRTEHAHKTLRAINRALAVGPDNTTALATLSILRLRVATLPWIVKLMAGDLPEASVEGAVASGRRCVERLPSVEHRLLLARALVACDRVGEARTVLQEATVSPPAYPRDRELLREAVHLLQEIQ